ncbi:Fur family transcriptional regulator [Basilea psittacipulmonis]|uniref:Uncharacterized protein n=1 Tax=Basilea psittacipulmonis DSM 24701 TaxID=1072685 RepID=A0A077DBE8_9BURK|nr:Fur family transcriptional regulator [Basilea psittacipulmonis]AIL31994.1 hypothetical protein IX83_00445 [Basilea psittacipulmonis DSM 24701]
MNNISEQLKKIEDICEANGTRLTQSRRQVLELILESPQSVKAYDLLKAMLKEHPNTKPPIVYRALEFLEQQHFIHRIDSLNAWAVCQHIQKDCEHGESLLLACKSCGSVKEIENQTVTHHLTNMLHEHGYQTTGKETEIQVICPNCIEQP